MKRNEIEEFVDTCNKSYECAKCAISKLKEDELAEYKAEIKAELFVLEGVNTLISYVALAIALLSVLVNCVEISKGILRVLVALFMGIVVVIGGGYLFFRYKKRKYIKALSYYEDYFEIMKESTPE